MCIQNVRVYLYLNKSISVVHLHFINLQFMFSCSQSRRWQSLSRYFVCRGLYVVILANFVRTQMFRGHN